MMTESEEPLQAIREQLWQLQPHPPKTVLDSLARIQTTVDSCIQAFQGNQWVMAQTLLEDTLAQALIATKMLDIQPDRALNRAIGRMREAASQQVFHIYADRVEIRVGSELRGGWALYTQDDYENAIQVAHTLGCDIIHHEAYQLGLFQSASS